MSGESVMPCDYKPGDRVKINTGSKHIASVDDFFGTIVGPSTKDGCFFVDTSDGRLEIHTQRLQKT